MPTAITECNKFAHFENVPIGSTPSISHAHTERNGLTSTIACHNGGRYNVDSRHI